MERSDAYLEWLTFKLLRDMGLLNAETVQRATYELDVIIGAGFSKYFLSLYDIFAAWNAEGIKIGAGRGSGAGSLVSFALGLTKLDPLKHGLVFERFMNPKRIGFPDLDTDLPQSKRQRALEIVREMYGDDYVAIIGTRGEIKAKKAIDDSARVLGNWKSVNKLKKMLPDDLFGVSAPLSAIDRDNLADEDLPLYDLAVSLEGLTRNVGQHAAGVIISPEPLSDIIPVRYLPDSQRKAGAWSGQITGYEAADLDALGLVKNDFLGIRNLDVVERVCEARGIDWKSLPIDPSDFTDQPTFDLLSSGDTLGVFQLDGGGMRQLLRQLRPTTFTDVAAVLALYRPGPMGAGSHKLFAQRKNKKMAVVPIHPELSFPEILDKTYGVIVFQEQIMDILRVVCGWDYGDADLVFNAMRKKDHGKLEKAKPGYEAAAAANGYSDNAIKVLWDTLIPFADYSFNKAHSASYAVLSYWTAYLKANYPYEFMAALLGSVAGDPDKLPEYLAETERLGIPILGPDINDSDSGFTSIPRREGATPGETTEGGLRYGLASIKGIAEPTAAAIKRRRPYKSLPDFFRRIDRKIVNVGVLRALVKSGALDSLFYDRISLESDIDRLTEAAVRHRENKGDTLFQETFAVVHRGISPEPTQLMEWEQETLGVQITKPHVTIRATKPLDHDGWRFLRKQLTTGSQTHYTLTYRQHLISHGIATLSPAAKEVFNDLGVEVR